MDILFKNSYMIDEDIVKKFYNVFYKRHKVFKKQVVTLCIVFFFAVLLLGIRARSTSALFYIALYIICIMLIVWQYRKNKTSRQRDYLYTMKKLHPTEEINYIFTQSYFGIEGGTRFMYDQVDNIALADEVVVFSAGTASWIFPDKGFAEGERDRFRKFVKKIADEKKGIKLWNA